ncbi:MAG TPA: hypothetical protein PLQ35_01450 [bacterium]|nr:hypothetical protein [bacterium]HQL60937.1 hypothetical protein [bacterium]
MSGTTVTALVSLKIFDNVAATALYALKDRLGYHQIRSLERSDYWRLSLPDLDEQTAVETIEQIVSRTALFANPNKHRWEIAADADPTKMVHKSAGETAAAILVEDEEDARTAGVREALLTGGSCGSGIEVSHGTLWVLRLGDLPLAEARSLAEEVAVTKARRRGLFSNPHYQRATVMVSGN